MPLVRSAWPGTITRRQERERSEYDHLWGSQTRFQPRQPVNTRNHGRHSSRCMTHDWYPTPSHEDRLRGAQLRRARGRARTRAGQRGAGAAAAVLRAAVRDHRRRRCDPAAGRVAACGARRRDRGSDRTPRDAGARRSCRSRARTIRRPHAARGIPFSQRTSSPGPSASACRPGGSSSRWWWRIEPFAKLWDCAGDHFRSSGPSPMPLERVLGALDRPSQTPRPPCSTSSSICRS
jgi:hypothetical protein